MQLMLILLPLAGYLLLLLFYLRTTAPLDVCEALVKAHLTLFVFIALSTEILSLFGRIGHHEILIVWLTWLICCAITVCARMKIRRLSVPRLSTVARPPLVVVGAILFILCTTFAAAILYPPNTWDSMTYHMSRVAHWMANKNVAFYPTSITRQNYLMPLAEFAILHLQLLTGTDLYANFVQWVSFSVLICLAPLVARELALNARQQLLSALIIATLPMAILQASSTQNDLVVSSFLAAFVLFMLRLREKLSAKNCAFTALAFGLALLTKGTAFIYCAALGPLLAIPILLRHKHDRKAILALCFVVTIGLCINAGHLWRNYRHYGNPLSTETGDYLNAKYGPRTLVSNLLRNSALHTGTSFDRIDSYQKRILTQWLGAETNNPSTTWSGQRFDIPYSRHEGNAGNFIHMIAILLATAILPMEWHRGRQTNLFVYAAALAFAAALYCLILKWQPWATRLHTPLFALTAPLLAAAVAGGSGRVRKVLATGLVLSMVLYSVPFALASSNRPLLSFEWKYKNRIRLYFMDKANLYNDYYLAMTILREVDAKEVGLYLDGDDWEYPFWAMAWEHKVTESIRFRHAGDGLFPPYLIATKPLEDWRDAHKYALVFASGDVAVYKRKGS